MKMRLVAVLPLVLLVSAAIVGCDSPGPEAQFTASPVTGNVPVDVQFTDLSEGNIDMWEWDFDNDGIVDSSLQNPHYTYTFPGNYTVSLRVSGPSGSDTHSRAAYLDFSFAECKADFIADTTSCDLNAQVRFSDRSTGEISGWAWDFDSDGSIDSTEQNPAYVFERDGLFSVSLTVMCSNCEDKITKIDYVNVLPDRSCSADFVADRTTVEANTEVRFSDRSKGEVTTWSWDFDSDGVVDSTEQNPVYIYGRGGRYTVSLTVAGPHCTHTKSRFSYIQVSTSSQCNADFIASTTSGTGITTVQFTDNSTGDIETWAWDLNGDGIIDSTAQSPVYTYRNNGYYSVSLTVSGIQCENTLTRKDYIRITGCST